MITIKDPLGADYNMNLEDVFKVKKILQDKGYYKVPDYGLTPYPDTRLFIAIKAFQKDNNLKIDGVISPNGQTIKALNDKDQPHMPGVQGPIMRCPRCGATSRRINGRFMSRLHRQDAIGNLEYLLLYNLVDARQNIHTRYQKDGCR
ncbi:MAG: hypothetical protein DI626_07555 [Micavibrio aeruginosavorus]|uniref:Peptidoglycan binding-like domain-containing protein n=1 Tax=Micavibrio aeruginosavorus TaxID=349221 RepID=A0A2W4ZWD7_9BACT|nr:MAG: hypothetical protein DI626_07555 [Micavibrio aeruginosavorus]